VNSTDWKRKARIADWVRRWNYDLTRFVERRVRVRADAEDLAQEVYLRLLRTNQIDVIAEPQAYLYRMASNVAAEWRVRARESKPHSADELETLLETKTPEIRLDQAQDKARFDAALDSLGVMVRSVIFLKLREGMTNDEIARHLDITKRMVKRYLVSGYAELRVRLIPE
jgi:RNA polymerase sigma-70 factor (ECF subfamily)